MPILNWLTREDDLRRAAQVPYRLLEEVPALSHGDRGTGNMLIQGDNLDVLKALLPYYAGQVKCSYADVPFNTQQAFTDYDDNLEHTLWLSTMYPVLELQRDLLSLEGTLVIHIDDNELGYMIAIADEVMGRSNRAGMVTFKQGSAVGHKAINPGLVNTTNFLLIYARSKAHWKPAKLFTSRDRDRRYGQIISNPDAHYTRWKLESLMKAFAHFCGTTLGSRDKVLAG